jgi:hypothetical protein
MKLSARNQIEGSVASRLARARPPHVPIDIGNGAPCNL